MKLPLLSVTFLALVAAGCNTGTTSAQKSPASKPAEPASPHTASNPNISKEKIKISEFVGKPSPGFEFVLSDGNQKSSDDFKGKVVLLDFWATWCVTCKAASPTMQKWHQAYSKKGLAVIGVNTFESNDDKLEKNKKILASAEACNDYAKEHKYTYDFATYGDSTAERWSIGGVPAFVLIGKDGTVLAVETNAKPETLKKLEDSIKKALG